MCNIILTQQLTTLYLDKSNPMYYNNIVSNRGDTLNNKTYVSNQV
jgi:hypothetical protein